MDDISLGYLEDVQGEILDWFAANKVKFNFHIITKTYASSWPTNCKTNPLGQYCQSPVVKAVQRVVDEGLVLGTGEDAFLQLGCHAHDHEEWPAWIYGQSTGTMEQESDLEMSMNILNAAYPTARIRSFAAPGNMANAATVQACLDKGLDIVSTQASLTCDSWQQHGEAPGWNYNPGPCGNSFHGSPPYHWDCIPDNDTYYTADGFQKANGVYSLPSSSANSNMETVEYGISVEDAIGVDACGCNITTEVCPMVAAAKEMAAKSNGLHWTVMIMHPQTNYTPFHNMNYTQWLDEFMRQTSQLEEYDVQIVTLEDLTALHAEHGVKFNAPETIVV